MLFTFSDFTAFKEMFLDYKAVSYYDCFNVFTNRTDE
jgi:hypothetical protein